MNQRDETMKGLGEAMLYQLAEEIEVIDDSLDTLPPEKAAKAKEAIQAVKDELARLLAGGEPR
jgi:hypothetical protein